MKILGKYWEIIFALGTFWGILILLILLSVINNQGYFIYAQDDAYIHMAIAKNLVENGIWGVTKYGYSSCSSSLLFPLLLSFFFIVFGVNELIPLILNIIFGTLILYVVYIILKKQYKLPSFIILLSLASVIFFVPLPRIIFTGMEHTLHILITIIFVYFLSKILSKEKGRNNKGFKEKRHFYLYEKLLLSLVPLVTMIRYEGIFLVIITCLLLFLKRKFLYSLLLGIVGLLPIIIYGIISTSFGWYLLPNSLLIKGKIAEFSSLSDIIDTYIYQSFKELMICPHLLFLLLGAFIILYFQCFKKREFWKDSNIFSIIFICITFLQIIFAGTGIHSRYDAYLVALGIIMILTSIKDYIPSNFSLNRIKLHLRYIRKNFSVEIIFRDLIILLGSFLILSPFIYRTAYLVTTVEASNDIYEQQYQMALFIQKYYEEEVVAVNDIGAVNYLADIICFDLLGLINLDVANCRMNKKYDNETMCDLVKNKGCKIAIINYPFSELPSQWIKVGEWIYRDTVLGFNSLSFYAVDPTEESNLISNLKDFSDQLPDNIIESGLYSK